MRRAAWRGGSRLCITSPLTKTLLEFDRARDIEISSWSPSYSNALALSHYHYLQGLNILYILLGIAPLMHIYIHSILSLEKPYFDYTSELSEDMFMCRKCFYKDIDLYIDWDGDYRHIGLYDYRPSDFENYKNTDFGRRYIESLERQGKII